MASIHGETPKTVLRLIIITICVSLFSALTETLFAKFFGWSSLQMFLGLSWWGLDHNYYWQFFTYMFVQNSYQHGVTLLYLISLTFRMYVLWIMGSTVCQYAGERQFLVFYFTAGILTALASMASMWLIGASETLAGPGAAILAVFTAWAMLNPETELMLLFSFTLKIKWLYAALLTVLLLLCISQLDFVSFVYFFFPVVLAYLIMATIYEKRWPFPWLKPIDKFLNRLGHKWRNRQEGKTPKILEIFSGKPPLDDDAFVDAMLRKISEKGTNSLSWAEKRRMDDISAGKKQKLDD